MLTSVYWITVNVTEIVLVIWILWAVAKGWDFSERVTVLGNVLEKVKKKTKVLPNVHIARKLLYIKTVPKKHTWNLCENKDCAKIIINKLLSHRIVLLEDEKSFKFWDSSPLWKSAGCLKLPAFPNACGALQSLCN